MSYRVTPSGDPEGDDQAGAGASAVRPFGALANSAARGIGAATSAVRGAFGGDGDDFTIDLGDANKNPQILVVIEEFDRAKDGTVCQSDLIAAAQQLRKLRTAGANLNDPEFLKGIAASNETNQASFPLACFPKELHDTLAAFDKNQDGFVSATEMALSAHLLVEERKKKDVFRRLLYAAGVLVFLLVLVNSVLTSWIVNAAKDTSVQPNGGEGVVLMSNGGDQQVLVANAATDVVSRVMRDRVDGSVVQQDTIKSYALLTDLIMMPLPVLDSIGRLTFSTADGEFHSFSGFSAKLSAPGAATRKLTLLTTVAGTSIEINADKCYLITPALTGQSTPTRTRILVPVPTVASSRRLAMLEGGGELVDRCNLDGICLHTMDEIIHLHHGSEERAGHHGRALAASEKAGGVSYAQCQIDPNTMASSSGWVSWDEEVGVGVVPVEAAAEAAASAEPAAPAEYDQHGCLVQPGFESFSYPLLVSTCVSWRETATCSFSITDGKLAVMPGVATLDRDAELDLPCADELPETRTGYCECGSGRKVSAGACGVATPVRFTCEQVCAAAAGEDVVSFASLDIEGRLRRGLEMSPGQINQFVTVGADAANGTTVKLREDVYLSTRLGFQTSSKGAAAKPAVGVFPGSEVKLPPTVKKSEVRAWFQGSSLSSNGKTWTDLSGNGRDAVVVGASNTAALNVVQANAVSVVSGKSDIGVNFHADTLPQPVTVSEVGALLLWDAAGTCLSSGKDLSSDLRRANGIPENALLTGADMDWIRSTEGACKRQNSFCTDQAAGQVYEYKDCDGDGIPDPTCRTQNGHINAVWSSNGCVTSTAACVPAGTAGKSKRDYKWWAQQCSTLVAQDTGCGEFFDAWLPDYAEMQKRYNAGMEKVRTCVSGASLKCKTSLVSAVDATARGKFRYSADVLGSAQQGNLGGAYKGFHYNAGTADESTDLTYQFYCTSATMVNFEIVSGGQALFHVSVNGQGEEYAGSTGWRRLSEAATAGKFVGRRRRTSYTAPPPPPAPTPAPTPVPRPHLVSTGDFSVGKVLSGWNELKIRASPGASGTTVMIGDVRMGNMHRTCKFKQLNTFVRDFPKGTKSWDVTSSGNVNQLTTVTDDESWRKYEPLAFKTIAGTENPLYLLTQPDARTPSPLCRCHPPKATCAKAGERVVASTKFPAVDRGIVWTEDDQFGVYRINTDWTIFHVARLAGGAGSKGRILESGADWYSGFSDVASGVAQLGSGTQLYMPYSPDETQRECTTAEFDGSDSGLSHTSLGEMVGFGREVTLAGTGFVCPQTASKANWVSHDVRQYGNTFSITQSGSRVTARRTDSLNSTWDMLLKIQCCKPLPTTGVPSGSFAQPGAHDDGWVLSSSTNGFYRSNFVNRGQAVGAISLQPLNLQINGGGGVSSDFEMAELIVVDRVLTAAEVVEMETMLFKRLSRLFVRGHYTPENFKSSLTVDNWLDSGTFLRHATYAGTTAKAQSTYSSELIIKGKNTDTLTFPTTLFPANNEYTSLHVARYASQAKENRGKIFAASNMADYADGFNEGMTGVSDHGQGRVSKDWTPCTWHNGVCEACANCLLAEAFITESPMFYTAIPTYLGGGGRVQSSKGAFDPAYKCALSFGEQANATGRRLGWASGRRRTAAQSNAYEGPDPTVVETLPQECIVVEMRGADLGYGNYLGGVLVGYGRKNNLPSAGYVCPTAVSKNNWLGSDTYGDTFTVTQSVSDNTVTARRTDGDLTDGWGMHLQFRCCKAAATAAPVPLPAPPPPPTCSAAAPRCVGYQVDADGVEVYGQCLPARLDWEAPDTNTAAPTAAPTWAPTTPVHANCTFGTVTAAQTNAPRSVYADPATWDNQAAALSVSASELNADQPIVQSVPSTRRRRTTFVAPTPAPRSWDDVDPNWCTTVTMLGWDAGLASNGLGFGRRNYLDSKYICPTAVSKNNWLGSDTYGDTFTVTQSVSDNTVTARRTDGDLTDTWGMVLMFECCLARGGDDDISWRRLEAATPGLVGQGEGGGVCQWTGLCGNFADSKSAVKWCVSSSGCCGPGPNYCGSGTQCLPGEDAYDVVPKDTEVMERASGAGMADVLLECDTDNTQVTVKIQAGGSVGTWLQRKVGLAWNGVPTYEEMLRTRTVWEVDTQGTGGYLWHTCSALSDGSSCVYSAQQGSNKLTFRNWDTDFSIRVVSIETTGGTCSFGVGALGTSSTVMARAGDASLSLSSSLQLKNDAAAGSYTQSNDASSGKAVVRFECDAGALVQVHATLRVDPASGGSIIQDGDAYAFRVTFTGAEKLQAECYTQRGGSWLSTTAWRERELRCFTKGTSVVFSASKGLNKLALTPLNSALQISEFKLITTNGKCRTSDWQQSTSQPGLFRMDRRDSTWASAKAGTVAPHLVVNQGAGTADHSAFQIAELAVFDMLLPLPLVAELETQMRLRHRSLFAGVEAIPRFVVDSNFAVTGKGGSTWAKSERETMSWSIGPSDLLANIASGGYKDKVTQSGYILSSYRLSAPLTDGCVATRSTGDAVANWMVGPGAVAAAVTADPTVEKQRNSYCPGFPGKLLLSKGLSSPEVCASLIVQQQDQCGSVFEWSDERGESSGAGTETECLCYPQAVTSAAFACTGTGIEPAARAKTSTTSGGWVSNSRRADNGELRGRSTWILSSEGEMSSDVSLVGIQSLALCRKITTAVGAISVLPPSTLCPISGKPNPTCQPTKLVPMWTETGVRFKWKAGCRKATTYQLRRDRSKFIGQDFVKEEASAEEGTSAAAQKEFCSSWIEPGQQLVDDAKEVVSGVGRTFEYCVRSMVPFKDGKVIASEWTCAATTILWSGTVTGSVMAARGGAPVAGAIVSVVVCDVGDLQCAGHERRKMLRHQLGDGGQMLSFSAFATQRSNVAITSQNAGCSYAVGAQLKLSSAADKPTFELVIDRNTGLLWHASAPSCWLSGTFSGASSSRVFTVRARGIVQKPGVKQGFAFHLQVMREPSWRFMSRSCRKACGLTSLFDESNKDGFASSAVDNVMSEMFCLKLADRCVATTLFPGITNPGHRGALIFGADQSTAEDVLCDPHQRQYAYYDAKQGLTRCCAGAIPSDWDSCSKRFTTCSTASEGGVVGEAGTLEPVASPERHFRIAIETAIALSEDEAADGNREQSYLDLFAGTDQSELPSEVHLVDSAAAASQPLHGSSNLATLGASTASTCTGSGAARRCVAAPVAVDGQQATCTATAPSVAPSIRVRLGVDERTKIGVVRIAAPDLATGWADGNLRGFEVLVGDGNGKALSCGRGGHLGPGQSLAAGAVVDVDCGGKTGPVIDVLIDRGVMSCRALGWKPSASTASTDAASVCARAVCSGNALDATTAATASSILGDFAAARFVAPSGAADNSEVTLLSGTSSNGTVEATLPTTAAGLGAASNGPRLVAVATPTGKPALAFGGGCSTGSCPSSSRSALEVTGRILDSGALGLTVVVVLKPNGTVTGSTAGLVVSSGSALRRGFGLSYSATAVGAFTPGGGLETRGHSSGTGWAVASMRVDLSRNPGANSSEGDVGVQTVRVGGEVIFSVPVVAADAKIFSDSLLSSSSGPFTLGGASTAVHTPQDEWWFGGMVAELAVFSSALSDADLAAVEASLATTYIKADSSTDVDSRGSSGFGNYAEAERTCFDHGARLCSLGEVQAGVGIAAGVGCSLAKTPIWVQAPTPSLCPVGGTEVAVNGDGSDPVCTAVASTKLGFLCCGDASVGTTGNASTPASANVCDVAVFEHDGASALTAAAEAALPIEVQGAWVGSVAKFSSARGDDKGSFTVPVKDGLTASLAKSREIYVIPALATEFVNSSSSGDQFITTKAHVFTGSSGESLELDTSGVTIDHRTTAMVPLQDSTAVVVGVRVTHAHVDQPSSCGSTGVVMCAFTADQRREQLDCKVTDETGLALLSVPVGLDIMLQHGCPADPTKRVADCDGKEGAEIGLDVLNADQSLGVDGDATITRVTAARAIQGEQHLFTDLTSRTLAVSIGAGRVTSTAASDGSTVFNYDTLFALNDRVISQVNFSLTHSAKSGCDATALARNSFVPASGRVNSKQLLFKIPRSLAYSLRIGVSEGGLSTSQAVAQRPVKTYMESLPVVELKTDEASPAATFAYRKKATLSLHLGLLQSSDKTATVPASCDSSGLTLFGMPQIEAGKTTPQAAELTVVVAELYTSDEVAGEAELILMPGKVSTVDNLAFSPAARTFVTQNLRRDLGTSKRDLPARAAQCQRPDGCDISGGFVCDADDFECPIEASGQHLQGTLFEADFQALAPPERVAPWTKVIKARFTPAVSDVPSAVQVALLTTGWTQVSVVVTGEVSLSAFEAVKIPEYVPFLILRDPPGSDSSTSWTKGSTAEVALDVSIADSKGNSKAIGGSVGVEFEMTTAMGVSFGAHFDLGGLPAFGISAEYAGEGSSGASAEKVRSQGNSLTLSAELSYSTSGDPGLDGAASDLFVTPSLAIRTLKVLPVIFQHTGGLCGGLAGAELTKWQLLDANPEEGTLSDALSKYMTAEGTLPDKFDTSAADVRKVLAKHARQGIDDPAWNSVTVHTTYDILFTRIPQLMALCAEERERLWCEPSFSASSIGAPDQALIETICGTAALTPASTAADLTGGGSCVPITAFTGSASEIAVEVALSTLRLRTSVQAVKGWRRAIRLNENLKDKAQAVSTNEILASPLLPDEPVGFPKTQGAELSAFDVSQTDKMAETDLDGNSGAETPEMQMLHKDTKSASNGAGYRDNVWSDFHEPDSKMNSRRLRAAESRRETRKAKVPTAAAAAADSTIGGAQKMIIARDETSTPAQASLIAFSGGGQAVTRSYSSARSTALALTFESEAGDANMNSFDIGFNMAFVSAGIQGTYEAETSKTKSAEQTRTLESETSVEYTLADDTPGDYFDVNIKRDPVYGTPVFETVAGRSMCPHEAGTDPREKFSLEFDFNANPLDLSGASTLKNRRNIVRPHGATLGTCAEADVILTSQVPFSGDGNILKMEVQYSGLASGIAFKINGGQPVADAANLPWLNGRSTQRHRLSFCPNADARHFDTRPLDTIPGGNKYVYCNVAVVVSSQCEWELSGNGIAKITKWKDDMTDCGSYDFSTTFPATSSACWNKVLTNVFDGDALMASEDVINARVVIPCLSFDPTQDGCASNPCGTD